MEKIRHLECIIIILSRNNYDVADLDPIPKRLPYGFAAMGLRDTDMMIGLGRSVYRIYHIH